MAADIYAGRRMRDDVFSGFNDGFGEAAWDILLVLYIADQTDTTQTASDLVAAAGVEPSIAKLYVGWLGSQGLIKEQDDTVVMLDTGRARMNAFMDRISLLRGGGGVH